MRLDIETIHIIYTRDVYCQPAAIRKADFFAGAIVGNYGRNS